jgi:hypothetical protein
VLAGRNLTFLNGYDIDVFINEFLRFKTELFYYVMRSKDIKLSHTIKKQIQEYRRWLSEIPASHILEIIDSRKSDKSSTESVEIKKGPVTNLEEIDEPIKLDDQPQEAPPSDKINEIDELLKS